VKRAGFIPLEPNWFINHICIWFGGSIWDAQEHRFRFSDPNVVRAYEWIAGYSRRLGQDALTTFQSGFGNFDSPQNAFIAGQVVMQQQGPWMANFIGQLKPSMSQVLWTREQEMTRPPDQRPMNYEWAVEAFPSAVPGLEDVTYCGFDVMTIPRGARHKREAFEFIAYVNRQDVIEKLNKLHCKNSPLANVSEEFLNSHPNPYVRVFERLANSPNARPMPQIPIAPEVLAEMNVLVQRVALLQVEPAVALKEIETRLQAKYDQFVAQQRARNSTAR
jgi:multiple sugar transport system substrate-binding protein